MYIVGNTPKENYSIKGVTMERKIFNEYTGEILQGARVNPNKYLFGDNKYITSYTQLLSTVNHMLTERGINDYAIQRLDFRIDNYNNNFDDVYKLNNIVVNLLAMSIGVQNSYKSLENDTPHNIIARSKQKGIEIECYNRIAKDGGGIAKTRLELRRIFPYFRPIKAQDIILIYNEFLKCFNSKLLPLYYTRFQAEQNNKIVHAWQNGIQRGTTRNYIDLIAKNKDMICTSKQMSCLCDMLGLAKDVSYTYKNRLQIEYYRYSDIKAYIDIITNALNIFLTS